MAGWLDRVSSRWRGSAPEGDRLAARMARLEVAVRENDDLSRLLETRVASLETQVLGLAQARLARDRRAR